MTPPDLGPLRRLVEAVEGFVTEFCYDAVGELPPDFEFVRDALAPAKESLSTLAALSERAGEEGALPWCCTGGAIDPRPGWHHAQNCRAVAHGNP
jgi:hypothetical protein